MKNLSIVGLTIFFLGIAAFIVTVFYEIAKESLVDTSAPPLITFGVVSVVVGIIVILISLIIERRKDIKKGE